MEKKLQSARSPRHGPRLNGEAGLMSGGSPTLDYLGVLRARKWVVLLTIAAVPAVAIFFSLREQSLYQATATVLLQDQQLGATLAGVPSQASSVQPDRFAQTQADVARSPTVIVRTLAAAGVRTESPADLLANSGVSSRSNADVLDFQVTDPRPSTAALLANEYARQFVRYKGDLDNGDIGGAVADVQRQIAALSARGDRSGAQYLAGKLQQLQAIQALQSPAAVLVGPASGASRVQPQPFRSAVLAFGLALVLGIALAFLADALDSRVRSAEEIGEHLGLPLLGRVPAQTGPRAGADRTPFVPTASDASTESFRMLRVALDLINLETPSRTIMVTSAVEGYASSMTAAGLALSFARAGRRVVLVDLDFRTARLGRRFSDGRPGIIEVALGGASLDDALVPIALAEHDADTVGFATHPVGSATIPDRDSTETARQELRLRRALDEPTSRLPAEPFSASPPAARPTTAHASPPRSPRLKAAVPQPVRNGNRSRWSSGAFEFLASSEALSSRERSTSDPGEFLGSRSLADILTELSNRADVVIIDAPPLLGSSDTFTLGAGVDAVLLVARVKTIRRAMLNEVQRLLERCPARKLGLVVVTPNPSGSSGSALREQFEAVVAKFPPPFGRRFGLDDHMAPRNRD
jgi:Mrp family chromosome partitioning ATPase/capsular polysaccharide biosynthesis protein